VPECLRYLDATRRGAHQNQRDRACGDHQRDRQGVEDVFDRQGRERHADRHAIANARDLGGLPDKRSERRCVPERVAGDDGAECACERQPMWRLDADRPCRGADGKAQSPKQQNPPEIPTDLTKAAPDFGGADRPDQPGEKRRTGQRREHADSGDLVSRRCRRHAAII
jgi:hypothetical protein